MKLITCENLTLGYEGKALLSGLSFTVESGNYLCIVGENGSGKSTLMKTLLHLQPPMSGTITMGEGLKINEIGYLPQQTALQRDFPASVEEIVMSGFLGSSRESFSPGRFVQPEKFFCWMSLFPDLIRWLWQICIRLSTS